MKKETSDVVVGLIVLCVCVVVVACYFDSCAETITGRELDSDFDQYYIERAEDCVKKYHIAGRSGYHNDAEDEARMAANYYLDAGDEANYRKWKRLEEIVEEYIERNK